MGVFLSAVAYAWVSHALAWALLPWSVARAVGVRALALWIGAAAALFLLRDPMATILVVGCLMAILAPLQLTARAAFFLIAVPTLPIYVSAPIPFPGINLLTILSNYKIAVIAVLLPLYFYAGSKRKPAQSYSLAGICLLLYVALTAIIVTGVSNPTNGLRFLVDQLLILAIPFFAIRFAVKTLDDVDQCLVAFLIASIFLAAVTLIASVKQWDFYSLLQPVSILFLPDTRSGFVRINATANTHSLGYHLAAGLIVLQYLRTRMGLGWLRLNAVRFVLLTGIYFTDSRGSMVALLIAVVVYSMFSIVNTKRLVGLVALAGLGGIGGATWLATAAFPDEGSLGSFTYRQELLRTSIPYILDHPFFGDYNFYTNRAFEHLVQGQGIIDITNLYLQVALHYGLLGFGLFFLVVLTPLSILAWRGLRRSQNRWGGGWKSEDNKPRSTEWRHAAGALAGTLSGWLFLVATTSDAGLTVHIGLVFAALAQGLCDLSNGRRAIHLYERRARTGSLLQKL
jgi:hypothetical protein